MIQTFTSEHLREFKNTPQDKFLEYKKGGNNPRENL